jgi:uncharacterized protein
MATILLTGGTGLIGKNLTRLLIQKGHTVYILSRSQHQSDNVNIKYALWDVEKQEIDDNAVASADFIIHLAGAGIADRRWTDSRKQEIVESRTKSSGLLVNALKKTPNKVQAVISASAIGWYGADSRKQNSKPFIEDMPAASDFLGDTCRLWEASIEPVKDLGIRLVKIRTGIVLSNDGGALAEFKKPIRFGVAAILGNGKQVISWIHINDICRMYLYALENEQLKGAYNAVAKNPVTNRELTEKLADKMKGSFYVSVYIHSALLKIALGEMSIEVLKSTTVSNEKIRDAGFNFLYNSIDESLRELVE